MREPLFKINSVTHDENSIEAALEIDQQNDIFKGHFPDHPIVPGASMLQMVKEVLAEALSLTLRLTRADNIKFLALVEPGTATDLQLNINYQQTDAGIKINASLLAGELVCMKLQALFVVE